MGVYKTGCPDPTRSHGKMEYNCRVYRVFEAGGAPGLLTGSVDMVHTDPTQKVSVASARGASNYAPRMGYDLWWYARKIGICCGAINIRKS